MLFIPDVQYYVPVKLCTAAGIIQLFKNAERLIPENVKLEEIYYGTLQN